MRGQDLIAARAAWYASCGGPKEGFPPGFPPGSRYLVPQLSLQSPTAGGERKGVIPDLIRMTMNRGSYRRLDSVSDVNECLGGYQGQTMGRNCVDFVDFV